MSPAEENRLYDLATKQKTFALNGVDLKELLRLSQKKAKETAMLSRQKSSKSES